ncbi:thiamine pyrophosphate-dependent enzyme [Nocardioides halotolerans]|uniref:thiamine pyrophosphate-dependent enzyme n=1 Tax=Nocardioides halotolerans TaxID=433660 RepID=UPI000410FAC1|nr:thiamine pyrophosphate-dependent enzyme [Nocardioides halotolerans]
MEPVDEHFLSAVDGLRTRDDAPEPDADLVARLEALFLAQAESRHLDLAARQLQQRGIGFYTIASAGHESNAALGLLSRATDPALLHYRSGGFYAARAHVAGGVDPVRETLRSLTCSAADPISGGRHKVFGHAGLHVVPQTSTIASHLPRAVGLGFALGLARQLGRETPWPEDAVVIATFGDASLNHSTAAGAFNAAAYLTHVRRDCPVLLVCEDNRIGISTRTPAGWPATVLQHLPGLPYVHAAGHEPVQLLETTAAALDAVRTRRAPAVLHLSTVRFMGHAGSDVEMAYRSQAAIQADLALDPLLGTARALVEGGHWSAEDARARYEQVRQCVHDEALDVGGEPRLTSREEVMAPLELPRPLTRPTPQPPDPSPLTLAQAINRTLAEALEEHADVLVFGEDVAVKGGIYGVTRGLRRRFGAARVFDTLLDEQTVVGTALGTALAGFVPVPEIQYLAYLHNAEDQLRGEAATLRFFSDGQYSNGMVVRVPGLAYQKGFGGHFHNDNALAVLRDVPGIAVAVASHPHSAPGLLRGCLDLARAGRVCVYVEPIARYHTRDLFDGDQGWLAPFDSSTRATTSDLVGYGTGRDLVIVTFGNGVFMSLRVARALRAEGFGCTVLDLAWVAPLPVGALLDEVAHAAAILVVDETRRSGGVSEAVVTALVDAGVEAPVARVASADSFVPLGPAADTVLLQEDEILAAALALLRP